jgi:hypothetical protein
LEYPRCRVCEIVLGGRTPEPADMTWTSPAFVRPSFQTRKLPQPIRLGS